MKDLVILVGFGTLMSVVMTVAVAKALLTYRQKRQQQTAIRLLSEAQLSKVRYAPL